MLALVFFSPGSHVTSGEISRYIPAARDVWRYFPGSHMTFKRIRWIHHQWCLWNYGFPWYKWARQTLPAIGMWLWTFYFCGNKCTIDQQAAIVRGNCNWKQTIQKQEDAATRQLILSWIAQHSELPYSTELIFFLLVPFWLLLDTHRLVHF